MSERELNRLEVVRDVDQGRLGPGSAAALMGITEWHVSRLLQAYRELGPAERYTGLQPTLAAEKLADLHNLRPPAKRSESR